MRYLLLTLPLALIAGSSILAQPVSTTAVKAAKAAAAVAKAEAAASPTVDPSDSEVQKAAPFSADERKVLHNLDNLPVDRLVILLQVYEKKDNTAMMDALITAILKRDPTNAQAIAARDLVNPKEETRRVGYLDALAIKVMAGEKIEDLESIAVQAASLCVDARPDEAVVLLEQLRANQFSTDDTWFELLDDLAYAYEEAGEFDKAEAAYNAVIKDTRFPADIRQEAVQALPALALSKRIASIRHKAGTDMEALVAGATDLYNEMPQQYEAIIFRIEAFDRARRYEDAISFLKSLRPADNTAPWAYLPTLAYAYYGARQYDEAVSTFREIHSTPSFDTFTKLEAENMILEIQVGREIERGMFAMTKGDTTTASSVLAHLETNYKTHRDTTGFKAIYLAKLGKFEDALTLLFAQRATEAATGQPFSQQDALADVYLEKKDFRAAHIAAMVMLTDRRYEAEVREAGIQKIQDIMVAERLEEGYRAIQDGNRAKAKAIGDDLAKLAPQRIEVRIYHAEVLLSYQRAREAQEQLLGFKAMFPNQPFPGQGSLAAAHAMNSQFEAADAAYAEILGTNGYEPLDRFDALWQRRALAPFFRPNLKTEVNALSQNEGTLLSMNASYETGWHNDWRYGVFTRNDFTSLDGLESNFGPRTDSRSEGGATVTRRFGNGYYGLVGVGASGAGAIYEAEVGKYGYQSLGWSLNFSGNARATDSLSLQALNGREDRITFHIGGPISDRLIFNLDSMYRWVKQDGSRLGQGYGFAANLDYVLQTETRKRPEITIGYFGEYRRLDTVANLPASVRSQVRNALTPKEQVRKALGANEEVRRASPSDYGREVFGNLIDPYTHSHGIDIKVRKHFGDTWAAYAQLGAYYSVDNERAAWLGATGVEYFINENSALYAEIRYDSNGQGAASQSGVWEANIGGQFFF